MKAALSSISYHTATSIGVENMKGLDPRRPASRVASTKISHLITGSTYTKKGPPEAEFRIKYINGTGKSLVASATSKRSLEGGKTSTYLTI